MVALTLINFIGLAGWAVVLASTPFNTCITFAFNALQAGVNAAKNSQSSANTQGNSSGLSSVQNASDSSYADGGFVLYPNMSNTNQMQSVYRKP